MDKLPFDIVLESEIPVRFGHSDNERRELMQTRSVEEMLSIISSFGLMELVNDTAVCGADGFIFQEQHGFLQKKDGRLFFVFDDPEKEPADLVEIDEDAEEIWRQRKDARFFILGKGDEGELIALIADKGQSKESLEAEIDARCVREYLAYAEIDSLHKLGKAINAGAKIQIDLFLRLQALGFQFPDA